MMDLRLFGRRLPPIVTSENNECGLACLAAVSGFFGGEHTLSDIRAISGHDGRGVTLLHIRDLAERLGLAARAVRLEIDALATLSTPAILHWDMNHFVVLEKVLRRHIIIMDPAAGRTHIPLHDVNKSFTGVALELQPSDRWRTSSKKPPRVSIIGFFGPVTRWRTDAVLITILTLLMELLVLVTPLQMQMSIDDAIQTSDFRLAWVLGIGFAIVVLLQASVALVRAWAAAVFSARAGFEFYDRFVRALHAKSPRFFLRHHTADILSRARSVDAIQSLLTSQLIQALLDASTSIAMVIVMFVAASPLALVVTGFGLLNMAVTGSLRRATIENSRRQLRVAAHADGLFLENARASMGIRLFGKEAVRISVWRNKFVELTNLVLTGNRLQMYSAQAAQLTAGLGNVVLISLGTHMVLRNDITLGTMIMFFVFRNFFVERLNNCVGYLMELRRVQTHGERVAEVVSDEGSGKTTTPYSRSALTAKHGAAIELNDVWFRYGENSPWVLRGVNLQIRTGESVAITGSSGCGKTTLMKVMLGTLEPERGEIRINGHNLKTIASGDYAAVIGVVMQDDSLFHGTVADNISFFDAPLDMQRVVAAAEKANIAREIESLPMQYYSLLAEDAQDISGGQKQRLFIARALYHDPSILFLDEATSHLDAESEKLVSEAVKSLKTTRILIAHRSETIATADRVLNLNASGEVVAQER